MQSELDKAGVSPPREGFLGFLREIGEGPDKFIIYVRLVAVFMIFVLMFIMVLKFIVG